ncbi:hypothetical protein CHARACLAT_029116 [Characodon lateralis]|uniref:Uncharacterized protein n=1 Tax=Characodon lateralis TaxID=208331 RepID=A0ABU7EXZ3_9TELE|nr:hypothetical protein [Characodon lateralis]
MGILAVTNPAWAVLREGDEDHLFEADEDSKAGLPSMGLPDQLDMLDCVKNLPISYQSCLLFIPAILKREKPLFGTLMLGDVV